MRNFLMVILPVFVLTAGCESGNNKVDDETLIDLGMAEGDRISMETQQLLGSTLKSTIRDQGIPEALRYCNLSAYPLVDSIEHTYSVIIKRASTDTRNELDQPDEDELKIIHAYRDSLAAGKTPQVLVEVGEKDVHYARPIMLNDEVCLSCHGRVGTDIAYENYQVIKALYPDDKATGHQLGDLRGIWSIRFNRIDLEKMADSGKDGI